MTSFRSRIALVFVLLVVGGLSWASREVAHRRLTLVGNPGWVTSDPDSLYQVRRVDRALREGGIAGTDRFLDHPHGSAIPWPPYYTGFLTAVLAPLAPRESEGPAARRSWIEMGVASVPLVLGVLTSLAAVLAAGALVRASGAPPPLALLAAATAGAYHALTPASIAYSKSGNGDHHAWVSLLTALALLVLTRALGADVLARRRPAAVAGAVLGVLAGVLVGSWVGSLLYVVQLELAFAWLLIVDSRRTEGPQPGLAALGLAFHGVALAALLPAVLASPWSRTEPWMVVNLSWFHAAFLCLGGLVFVPLFWLSGRAARQRYPFAVGGGLVLLGALVILTGVGPGAELREAFAWIGRTDAFMAEVDESRALDGFGGVVSALGWGLLVLPLAWGFAARAAARGATALVPWVVSAPLLALQAARQARFADALVLPLAVLAAWGLARLVGRYAPLLARLPALLLVVLSVALAGAANSEPAGRVFALWKGRVSEGGAESPGRISARTASDWLRTNRPSAEAPGEGVLALWRWGHVIEWAADRPTVATNFGSYVGENSFRDPCRFLMFEDPSAAEALLEERAARWVLVTSELPNSLNLMIRTAVPEQRARYTRSAAEEGGGGIEPAWFRTMGARLMFDGAVFYPGGPAPGGELARPVNFLRLVYVSPLPDPARRLRSPSDVSPGGWVWERVPGARVEARGRPGEVLTVEIQVRYAKAKRGLVWSDRAAADAAGVAALRVPYGTVVPNGDGWVAAGAARWTFGGRGGALAISERAVTQGEAVRVP